VFLHKYEDSLVNNTVVCKSIILKIFIFIICPPKTLWEKYEEIYILYVAKTPLNPVGKIRRK
jgi:hypothetical protein